MRLNRILPAMIGRLREAKINVVLMTPPRFAEDFPRDGLGDESNVRLSVFADRIRTVAAQTGLPLVDHFGGWTQLQKTEAIAGVDDRWLPPQ